MISAAPGRDSSRLRLVLLVDRDDDTREMYAEYFAAAAVGIPIKCGSIGELTGD
jgi:hypothetical protein